MLGLLWNYQIKKLSRYFSSRRTAKFVTVVLFALVFLGVAFGIYEFFWAGFTIIDSDQYFDQVLSLYIYEAYTLITMVLVLFSAFIVTLFSLFRAQENEWIVTSPHFNILPSFVMMRVFFSSLWPLLIIFVPGLIAVANVFGISALGFVMVLLSVILLTAFIVGLAFVVIMLLAKLMYALSKSVRAGLFSFRALTVATFIVLAFFAWYAWGQAIDVDFIKLFRAEDLAAESPDPSLITDRFKMFPSHTVAAAIYDWQYDRTSDAMMGFGILSALVVGIGILWKLVSNWFLVLWQNLQRGSFIATTEAGPKRQQKRSYRFKGGYLSALFKKEALVSFRNGKSVSWFLFLVFIWLIQVALNVVLSRTIAEHEVGTEGFAAVVQALQFVTTVFFISAFVLRFVFPAFSSERRTAWILANAPLKFSKLFWSKLLFFLSVFLAVGLIVGYGNVAFLGEPLASVGVTLLLFVTAVPLLVIYGLAMGALFPNFETDDPSVLSTSLPGFGFIVGSLLYGAVGAWFLYTYLTGGSLMPIVLYEVASVAIGLLLMYFAPRALDRIDFVKVVD